MTDDSKRLYPSGTDVSNEALATLLEEIAVEIRRGAMPVNGLLTQQEMDEAGDPLKAAIRVEYIPTGPAVMPDIALEDDDE